MNMTALCFEVERHFFEVFLKKKLHKQQKEFFSPRILFVSPRVGLQLTRGHWLQFFLQWLQGSPKWLHSKKLPLIPKWLHWRKKTSRSSSIQLHFQNEVLFGDFFFRWSSFHALFIIVQCFTWPKKKLKWSHSPLPRSFEQRMPICNDPLSVP